MKDYSQAFINTNGEEFPNTKAVNADTPGTTNGTEIIADLLNDNWGFYQALLKAASISPNGEDETAYNSQKLEAIKKLYGDADTAIKEELISKIEALKASDIDFDDSISISASDVQEAITALHTLIKGLKAKDIAIDNIDGITASNVQELGEALNQQDSNLQQKDTEILNKINSLKASNIGMDTISGLSASNVQQGLQALNNKINSSTSVFNLIPNGNEYKHPTELFNGKPVYYRAFYNSSGWSNTAVVSTVSNVDRIVESYVTTEHGEAVAIGDYAYVYNYSTKQIKYYDGDSGRKGKQIIFKYTKTTDSKIL